jgi:hypothetical protein
VRGNRTHVDAGDDRREEVISAHCDARREHDRRRELLLDAFELLPERREEALFLLIDGRMPGKRQ